MKESMGVEKSAFMGPKDCNQSMYLVGLGGMEVGNENTNLIRSAQ